MLSPSVGRKTESLDLFRLEVLSLSFLRGASVRLLMPRSLSMLAAIVEHLSWRDGLLDAVAGPGVFPTSHPFGRTIIAHRRYKRCARAAGIPWRYSRRAPLLQFLTAVPKRCQVDGVPRRRFERWCSRRAQVMYTTPSLCHLFTTPLFLSRPQGDGEQLGAGGCFGSPRFAVDGRGRDGGGGGGRG